MPGTQDSINGVAVANNGVRLTNSIPDSAIHRWILDDVGSGTATDYIGSADGTVSGVSNTTGDYQGGSAGDGDATDDFIDVATLGNFGSQMDSDFAVGFTIDDHTTTNTQRIFGGNDIGTSNETTFTISVNFSTDGDVSLGLADSNGDLYLIRTDSTSLNDGNKYRILINKTGNSGSGGMNFYIDGSQVSDTVDFDRGFSDPNDFGSPCYMFARRLNGADDGNFGGILDDFLLYDDSLTSSEIQQDYDAQPWT